MGAGQNLRFTGNLRYRLSAADRRTEEPRRIQDHGQTIMWLRGFERVVLVPDRLDIFRGKFPLLQHAGPDVRLRVAEQHEFRAAVVAGEAGILERLAGRHRIPVESLPADGMQQTVHERSRGILGKVFCDQFPRQRAGHRLAPDADRTPAISGQRLGHQRARSRDRHHLEHFAKSDPVHRFLDGVTGLAATEPGAVADPDDPGRHGCIQTEERRNITEI